jgi:hypothetical protein
METPNAFAESIAVIEAGITYTFPNPNYRLTDLQAGRIGQGNRESRESENFMSEPRSPSTTGPLTLSTDAGRLDALIALSRETNRLLEKCRGWLCIIALPVVLGIVFFILSLLANFAR